jgi:hypothetical protein
MVQEGVVLFGISNCAILKKNSIFNIENVEKRYSNITPIKNHPLLSNLDNLYDFKVWFDPNNNFFDIIKKTKKDKEFGDYSDFIDNIEVDFNELP